MIMSMRYRLATLFPRRFFFITEGEKYGIARVSVRIRLFIPIYDEAAYLWLNALYCVGRECLHTSLRWS